MSFRGTVTVIRRQQQPISDEQYSRVLAALGQRHDELGAVGGGGAGDTALYVLSTDRYDFEAPAVMEMFEAVADALSVRRRVCHPAINAPALSSAYADS